MAFYQQEFNNKSLLGNFLSYLRHPFYELPQPDQRSFVKFKQVFKLWSFVIVMAAILGVMLSWLLSFWGIGELDNTIVDLFLQEPLHTFLLIALIWAPITEELTFRLALKYSPWRLSVSVAFIITLIGAVLNEWLFLDVLPAGLVEAIQGKGLYVYILSVVVLSFALAHIFKSKLPREKVQEFYTKKFPVIFYASIIVFAVIHIFNFYNISNIWYILPLLVLPQLLFGALLAYIRMKYGISWSIVGHCLHNGMASLPLVFIALMPAGYMEMAEAGRINREIMTSEASLVSFVFSLIFIGVATLIFISVIKLLREYYRGKKKIG